MKKNTPCVFLPGFGQSKAVLCDDDGNVIQRLWPLSVDLNTTIKEITPPYLKTVLMRKDMGFSQKAYELFREFFHWFEYDENGIKKYNVKAVTSDKPISEYSEGGKGFVKKIAPITYLSENFGDENIFCFSYNAFDDPFDTADELNAFIENVKAETGADKVNLISYSMGGTVAIAYFSRYAEKKDIARTVFISGCLGGSAIQKAILTRDVDKKQGYSLLGFATNGSTVKTFKRVLALTPWQVRYNLLFRGLDAVEDGLLTTAPGMWALLPCHTAKEQMNRMLSDEKYALLRKRIELFCKAQENRDSIFRNAQDSGTEFFVIAAYGSRIMELCADASLNTDGILDITSTSCGALSAEKEKPFEAGRYVSEDGRINAGTCLFRDRTWLLDGEKHSSISRNSKVNELVNLILTAEETVSIDTNTEFPQFMKQ